MPLIPLESSLNTEGREIANAPSSHATSRMIILNDPVCIILPLNKAITYRVPEVFIYLAWNSAVPQTVSVLEGLDPEEVGAAPRGRQVSGTRELSRPQGARGGAGDLHLHC